MIEALVFDLDDTLYPEIEFVRGGYWAVARHVASRSSWPEDAVFCRMMTVFNSQGRDMVLSTVIDEFAGTSTSISELVEVYRRHLPSIRLCNGYEDLLQRLHHNFKIGILTDGLPEVQRRKVKALRLKTMVDAVIYTWDCGPELEKPHSQGFELIMRALDVSPAESVFIGDNPLKDGQGARNAGMRFIQVLSEDTKSKSNGVSAEAKTDGTVRNLLELPGILQLAGSYETN